MQWGFAWKKEEADLERSARVLVGGLVSLVLNCLLDGKLVDLDLPGPRRQLDVLVSHFSRVQNKGVRIPAQRHNETRPGPGAEPPLPGSNTYGDKRRLLRRGKFQTLGSRQK